MWREDILLDDRLDQLNKVIAKIKGMILKKLKSQIL
jgi:hypothetical protein